MNENIKGKTIKEMIASGTSPDELLSQLQQEINQAQEELEQEKKKAANEAAKQAELDALRETLINTSAKYLQALGVIDSSLNKDEINGLKQQLIEVEKDLKPTVHKTSFKINLNDDDWMNDIIEHFLNTDIF